MTDIEFVYHVKTFGYLRVRYNIKITVTNKDKMENIGIEKITMKDIEQLQKLVENFLRNIFRK